MKIIDRYTAGLYTAAFWIFIVAFILLYVLVDLVSRVSDFYDIQMENRLLFAVKYYLLRIPLFLTILLPIVTLFAALFTCHRLARNNEFLPMVSAGISLRRVAAPFFVAGALGAAAMAVLDEWILPPLGHAIAQSDRVLRRGDRENNLFVRDGAGNTFYFFAYTYSNFEARNAVVACFGPERRIEQVIKAARAVCEILPVGKQPGAWRFFQGVETRYRPNLEREKDKPIPPEGLLLETDLDPLDLARGERVGMTFHPIPQLLELAQNNPQTPLFYIRLHHRLASPLGPFLLLLLGIPFLALTHRQNLFIGVGVCILIGCAYYVTQFVCLDGGMRREMSPAMAGWFPTLLFGALGSGLFFRMMKT
jgi:lipopolysaccharide export system permease protein